jgi:hypothetical protein
VKKPAKISDVVLDLRSSDGFEHAMRLVDSAWASVPPQRLSGENLRRYVLGVTRTFGPGEKTIMATPPLEHDFQLEYVMVPEVICFDGDEARFFLHHDQIVPDIWKPGSGSKMPASLCLDFHSRQVQLMDLYRKHVYSKGEIFELGLFENTSSHPLNVKAAVCGIVRAGS